MSDVQGGTDGDKNRGRTIFLLAKKTAVDLTNKLHKIILVVIFKNVRTEIQDSSKWLEEKMLDSLMRMLSFLLLVFKKYGAFFVSAFEIN